LERYLSIIYFFCCCCAACFAKEYHSPAVNQTNIDSFYNSKVCVYEDMHAQVSIRNFIADSTIQFRTMDNNHNFGFVTYPVWIKIVIDNKTSNNQFYLYSIKFPLIEQVKFYEILANKITDSITTGLRYFFSSRRIDDRNFVFKLEVPSKTSKSYYIRLYSSGETLRLPVSIQKITDRIILGTSETFVRSIFYGYILFALVFNFLMILGFHKKQNALLFLFILSMSLFHCVIDGYAFQYFWPLLPQITNYTIVLFSMGACIAMLSFANEFIDNVGLTKKITIGFIIAASVIIVWNLIPSSIRQYSTLAANIYGFVVMVYLILLKCGGC